MARIVLPNATPAANPNAVLYGPNGQPVAPAAPPTASAPNNAVAALQAQLAGLQAQLAAATGNATQTPTPAPAAPRAPRAPAALGTVGGYAANAAITVLAPAGYNPHRATLVVNGTPTGTRYAAWQHVTQCGTVAAYVAGGPHCKPKYLQRWVAAGLLAIG